METLSFGNLTQLVANEVGGDVTKRQVASILKTTNSLIGTQMSRGKKVALSGLGTFVRGTAGNVRGAAKIPLFTPAKALKEIIQ